MRVTVLQGSPNLKGSTAMLVEEFMRGAREAGHEVERIDVARADIRPCTGCVACSYGARHRARLRDPEHDTQYELSAGSLRARVLVVGSEGAI